MKVSAVIPTIGRPELRRAVESVLVQTVPVTPVVVLDRPSKEDDVRRVLDGLAYDLVITPGALGGSGARNTGVAHSESDVIAFLDDDDEWLPEKTTRQLELLAVHPCAVITSQAYLIGRTSRVLPERPFDGVEPVSTYLLDRSTVRLRKNFIQSSTLLMARETALRYRWPEHLVRHQDWGLLIDMDRAGVPIITEMAPLARVFQGSAASISRSGAWKASEDWLSLHAHDASTRSKADFTASVVLRGALASRDWSVVPSILGSALRGRPHAAALVVGFSGMVQRS